MYTNKIKRHPLNVTGGGAVGEAEGAAAVPEFAEVSANGASEIADRIRSVSASGVMPDAERASNGAAANAPIGADDVKAANEELREYRAAREALNARIADNRLEWSATRGAANGGRQSGGWLFNSVINKHADAMDSAPTPCVLPREADDVERARALSEILPVILDNCGYGKLYSDLWWSKLIDGTAVTGVFWEPSAAGGRGDVSLCRIDVMNIYWEPSARDIQDSQAVYTLDHVADAKLIERYPILRGKLGEKSGSYTSDAGYSTVVDRYYKKGGKLHFMRFVGDTLLYASENDPYMTDGWYAHGLYPFVFDAMYPDAANGICGFGSVDVAKGTQRTIDSIDRVITRNALANARPRYFVRIDGGVSEDEFADTENEIVHVASSALGEDSIRQIAPVPLNDVYTSVLRMKIDELKETTGNRDFAQGFTASGVTSGVAIAALQEASSKLSRDVIATSCRALTDVCLMIIELVREFYVSPRSFRVSDGGNSGCRCVDFDGRAICPIHGANGLSRTPLFDVRIEQVKASAFSREVANERAMDLWKNGFFLPENRDVALAALSIMDFDGRDRLIQALSAEAPADTAEPAASSPRDPVPAASAAVTAATRVSQARRDVTTRIS